VDGACVSVTQRINPECKSGNDGTCSSCTDSYFLQSGGCYNARTFPGNTLCTEAQQGKCTQCANGQNVDTSGSCPSCATGCQTCDASAKETCKTCLPGYYLSGSSCIECDKSNDGIQGVANCVSCIILPSSSALTCYVKIDRGDDMKKSAFSTGAIAGISVVAVLVVGALIGFLCWWFLCKTKRAGVSSSTTTLIHSKSA
ncbi:Variant-specific surface protein, partial [Giardia duodenalis]